MLIRAAALVLLTATAATGADAACKRHIYNRSDSPWTFRATNSKGNVHFTGLFACRDRTNGPCTIPQHTSATIEYTTSIGIANGTWYIQDKTGEGRPFGYVGTGSACPSISHSGNTGAVALNDPASGDINAWGETWQNPNKPAHPPSSPK